MATAGAKTLAIPELLEAVLIELSPRDLILSQQVNKNFKSTIEKSTAIQQKLFFKLPPNNDDSTANINPLFGEVFRYLSTMCKIFIESSDQSRHRPYYQRQFWADAPRGNLRLDRATEQINVTLYKPIRTSSLSSSLQSSYENMLIADSPIKVVLYRGNIFSGAVATADEAPTPTLGGLVEACLPDAVESMENVALN